MILCAGRLAVGISAETEVAACNHKLSMESRTLLSRSLERGDVSENKRGPLGSE
jgi:hypothetical protein